MKYSIREMVFATTPQDFSICQYHIDTHIASMAFEIYFPSRESKRVINFSRGDVKANELVGATIKRPQSSLDRSGCYISRYSSATNRCIFYRRDKKK